MKIFLLFLFVALVLLFGVSYFYSAMVPLSKMEKLHAQVLDVELILEHSTRSTSRHLVFTIDNPVRIIKINYSTRTEAAYDTTLNTIQLGKTYTFYLNSSDLNSINAIDFNGHPIFRKPKGYRILIGLLVSFFGLIGLIIVFQKAVYKK